MSHIITDFTNKEKLLELYESSGNIIFSDNKFCDISNVRSGCIGFYINNQLIEIPRVVWRETNKTNSELPQYDYKLTDCIWNIFFIEYFLKYENLGETPLVSSNSDECIFNIYNKNIINNSAKHTLFFSNKLRTFLLHDVNNTSIGGGEHIIGQLAPHLKYENTFIEYKSFKQLRFECPPSWKKLSGNTFCLSMSSDNTEDKMIKEKKKESYYPIHIITELKTLIAWIILIWNAYNRDIDNKEFEFKKTAYVFTDDEHEILKKYAGDDDMITYIVDGLYKFLIIHWNDNILFDIYNDGEPWKMFPLISYMNNKDIYDKSRWFNNYFKKYLLKRASFYNNFTKIRMNIHSSPLIKNELQINKKTDIMQIDIGYDENKKLSIIVYMKQCDEMKRWKLLFDTFLNVWVK
jgi:hypothetical protein